MRSSFIKLWLLASIAVAGAASADPLAHVAYICEATKGSLPPFTLAFDQDREWAAGWDWNGDWDTQTPPSFSSAATVTIAGIGQNVGMIRGELIGGHTRLTGFAKLEVSTSGSLGKFELSLLEGGPHSPPHGHGTLNGKVLLVNCQGMAFFYTKRYVTIDLGGKLVCWDDKAGIEVHDGPCKRSN